MNHKTPLQKKQEELLQQLRLKKLAKMSAEFNKRLGASGANAPVNRIYVGERGGRYYKRTRQDGTTYREYTW